MSQSDASNTELSNLPVATGGGPLVIANGVHNAITRFGPIESAEAYEVIANTLKEVKHNLKMVDELEEAEKRPHLDALQGIREKYKPSRTSYSLAEAHLKKLIANYNDEQERLRREAQQAAEAAAERERERLRKQAEKAVKKGKAEEAAQLAERAESIVPPVIQDMTPAVAGVHTVDKWDFEVVDAKLVPSVYKIVDMKKLGKVVSALKEAARTIPGIRVFKRTIVASTSKQPEA
jgi:hypothetical protein